MVQYLSGNVQFAPAAIDRRFAAKISIKVQYKYGLKTKYAAELKLAAPIPEPEPEITVGAMWEDYLIWKQPQLQPTTFKTIFCGTYTNIIKGLHWDYSRHEFIDNGSEIYSLLLSDSNLEQRITQQTASVRNKVRVEAELSQAFTRLQSLGKTKLTVNPFVTISRNKENKAGSPELAVIFLSN